MIIKKIGFAVLYTIAAIVINAITQIFSSNGAGISYFSIVIISLLICVISYNLRIAKIKDENKGMESEEKAVFNDTVKRKISFIVKTADFKIEAVLYVIICVLYVLFSFVEVVKAYGIDHFLAYKTNFLMIFVCIVIIPLYMAGLDLFVWYKAYNNCYKTKAY